MGDLLVFPDRPDPGVALYCAGCGRDRTVPAAAADPGPCPECFSTVRISVKPVLGGAGGFGIRLRALPGVPAADGLEAGSWGLSGGSWGGWGGTAV